MALSQLLEEVYNSAPTAERIYRTISLHGTGIDTINLVQDYVPQTLMGIVFEPCQMRVPPPPKAADGPQSLTLSIGLVDSRAQRIAVAAIESQQEVFLTYREFLKSDRQNPARTPLVMTVTGGTFEGDAVSIEAQYFDMLNLSWPRDRYTADKAPGVKYL